jgi:HSP20 family protein
MAVVRRDNNTSPARYSRDPFSIARDLFGWEPFYGGASQAFTPTFEVKETNDQFVVRADVPGVEEKDVDISLHNGVLSISGTRTSEQRNEGDAYYVHERQYGSFSRSFALPDTADGDKVDASLTNGVLTVTIGKRAEAKPRKIAFSKKA